jgi:hypothetical protein
MRASRVIIAASGVAFCVLLASTTGNAFAIEVVQQQQQRQEFYVAEDADQNGKPDDDDRDGRIDHWIEVGLECANRCGVHVQANASCGFLAAVPGGQAVVWFCAAATAYQCARDCADVIGR